MKQDIMLICFQTEDFNELQNALVQSELSVTRLEGTQNALVSIAQYSPAFIILDFAMDDAENFLQEISKSIFLNPPPYILVADTFLDGLDCAAVLDLGADACIAKPIDPQEVIALIQAVLRREQKIARLQTGRITPPIEHKDLIIDTLHRTVTMCGVQVALAPKEFDILRFLAEHPGCVLSKETIYERVWKENPKFEARRVTDIIHSLRQKLGLASKDTDYIETVYRIGYRFARSK